MSISIEQTIIIFLLIAILLSVLSYLVYKVYKDSSIDKPSSEPKIYIIKSDNVRSNAPLNPNDNRYPSMSPTIIGDSLVPINIRTRNGGSGPPQYENLGNLYNDDGKILKLYGRRIYRGSPNYNYYALDGSFSVNRLSVINGSKDCGKEYGCGEVYDGDSIYIEELKKNFTVKLFDDMKYRYLAAL